MIEQKTATLTRMYWPQAISTGCWREGQVKHSITRIDLKNQSSWEEDEWTSLPGFYGPKFEADNQPRVGINWYEALAFTNWLTVQLGKQGKIRPDEVITLPSEAQWEKAARGTDGRIYPWGNEPDPNRANFIDTGNAEK